MEIWFISEELYFPRRPKELTIDKGLKGRWGQESVNFIPLRMLFMLIACFPFCCDVPIKWLQDEAPICVLVWHGFSSLVKLSCV